eukprot:68611-Prymnesium_polylepis.1
MKPRSSIASTARTTAASSASMSRSTIVKRLPPCCPSRRGVATYETSPTRIESQNGALALRHQHPSARACVTGPL